jgi:hypothetical protein
MLYLTLGMRLRTLEENYAKKQLSSGYSPIELGCATERPSTCFYISCLHNLLYVPVKKAIPVTGRGSL